MRPRIKKEIKKEKIACNVRVLQDAKVGIIV